MRFGYALFGVILPFTHYGCVDKPEVANDDDGTGGAGGSVDVDNKDVDSPIRGGKKIGPHLIKPDEKVAYAEGCQKYVFDGKDPALLKKFNRSNKCYEPITSTGSPPSTAPVEVTVYYQRHGESTWNVEHLKYGFRDMDKNTDAHLTRKGVGQALLANKQIVTNRLKGDDKDKAKPRPKEDDDMDKEILLKGSYKDHRVVFATSNLRRAALTFLITFKHLLKDIKKLHIVSALQELASHTDSDPLAGPGEIPYLSFATRRGADISSTACPFTKSNMEGLMNPACNHGNEKQDPNRPKGSWYPLVTDKTRATIDHIEKFCTWMYNVATNGEDFVTSPKPSSTPTDFVITGHSMYLRTFFDNFFQPDDKKKRNDLEKQLDSGMYRLKNTSIVRFKLLLTPNITGNLKQCSIVANSTALLYGKVDWRMR